MFNANINKNKQNGKTMRYQSFTEISMRYLLTKNERFIIKKDLTKDLDKIICDANLIAHELFRGGINIRSMDINSKKVYLIGDLSEKLVLRKCALNLRQGSNTILRHRNIIIEEIIPHLRDGTDYKVYRLDIKSFFESINISDLIIKLEQLPDITRHTKNIVKYFLNSINYFLPQGLPRGIEISPILSEIYLNDFDLSIRSDHEVFYYSRFVDDIIIVTSTKYEESIFIRKIQANLPIGLKLNKEKQKIIHLGKKEGQETIYKDSFEFLGYKFNINKTEETKKEKTVFRTVSIDFSKKRLSKLKTRISRAYYAYFKYGDFNLLLDRITFLTTNRDQKSKSKSRDGQADTKICTGIYYSNCKVDSNSQDLRELDFFLKKITLSTPIMKKPIYTLSRDQKNKLLKRSFVRGFNEKIYRRFNYNRAEEILRVWL
ncbi:reverse transcriptase [Yersinia enterocolitica]|uniref:antiviral reverse transcriptase Drt3a n=1 Tax=Yersinia enterocolitica TaxID=630 RepID=UPI0021E719B9|nr:antiviral reverse transcriptase Drt3a [Yersinia enterocolitica]EKN4005298.1 RNA-directed DNA polymerase [Yersinia enterocolitica]EKN4707850.1 RNA-directed DNA polymerase [Yersinia enterocolitica]EKN4905625.1 RNA-directed DNA polymerase [Yersinia enterocolitica]EKN6145726.1 reverse transcriptase [Yersinia enterocolitica]UYK04724.1 RNA-directed DNA polymerase [Yersinia enterocolitica]